MGKITPLYGIILHTIKSTADGKQENLFPLTPIMAQAMTALLRPLKEPKLPVGSSALMKTLLNVLLQGLWYLREGTWNGSYMHENMPGWIEEKQD